MSANTDVRDWIREQHSLSDHVRRFYAENWNELVDLYMNTLETPMPEGAEWIHNKAISDGFRVVETISPQLVMGMYQSDRWMHVDAPGVPGFNYASMVHAVLMKFTKDNQFVLRSIPEVRMQQMLGHGIQKTYWHVEETETIERFTDQGVDESGQIVPISATRPGKRIEFAGPWVEWPDLKDVWKSVETDRFGRHMWYLQQRDTTLDILLEENKKFGNKLYANLNELKKTTSLAPHSGSSGLSNAHEFAGFGFDGPFGEQNIQDQLHKVPRAQRQGQNAVTVFEFWGFVPPRIRSYQDTQWRLIEIANNEHVIRDHPCPTPDRRPPFDDIYAIKVGHGPYGYSPLFFIKDEIEQASIFKNLNQANMLMNIFGTYAADADIDFDTSSMFTEPSGILWYRNQGQGHKGIFEPIQRNSPNIEVANELAGMESHYLKTAGATEAFQGGFAPGGSHRTLGEFQGTVALGGARHRMQIMLNDLQSKLPFLKRSFRLAQVFMEDAQIIELSDNREARDEISLRDLIWDVNIMVDTGEFGNVDQQKLQNLIQLYSTFSADPTGEGNLAHDKRVVMEDAYFYAGFSRADRYLKPQEKIDEAVQKQQDEALIQEAIKGSGGSSR